MPATTNEYAMPVRTSGVLSIWNAFRIMHGMTKYTMMTDSTRLSSGFNSPTRTTRYPISKIRNNCAIFSASRILIDILSSPSFLLPYYHNLPHRASTTKKGKASVLPFNAIQFRSWVLRHPAPRKAPALRHKSRSHACRAALHGTARGRHP